MGCRDVSLRCAIVVAALLLAGCGGSSIEGRWVGHDSSGDAVVVAFSEDGEFQMPSLANGLYAVLGDTVVVTVSASPGYMGRSAAFLRRGDSLRPLDSNLGLGVLRRAR